MDEKGAYIVSFLFSEITKEQLDQVLDEIFQNAGIIPLKVEKKEV